VRRPCEGYFHRNSPRIPSQKPTVTRSPAQLAASNHDNNLIVAQTGNTHDRDPERYTQSTPASCTWRAEANTVVRATNIIDLEIHLPTVIIDIDTPSSYSTSTANHASPPPGQKIMERLQC
jgi:hypothetical protein